MTDELREQLRRLDPMHTDVPVEPATTSSSRTRLENIMKTPLLEPETDSPTPHPARITTIGRRRRGFAVLGGIAAATMLAVGAAAVLNSNDGGGEQIATGPPLELSLAGSDAMASCMPFDVNILADMSPAFAATATEVGDGTVTLAVDRWYTGGDAETVVLDAPPGMEALIAGFDFEVGQQYLITAANGTVNFCGFSGVATPEFTAAFDAAFGG